MDNVRSVAVLHRRLLVIYLNFYYYFINVNFSNEASKKYKSTALSYCVFRSMKVW